MILILTSRSDVTADYFAAYLTGSGQAFTRLDSEMLPRELRLEWKQGRGGPVFRLGSSSIRLRHVTGLWFRRPRPLRFPKGDDPAETRHAATEYAAALEGLLEHIPTERWINHPALNVRASHKLEQLTRAKSFGLSIPKTLLTPSSSQARLFWRECAGEVIVKPLGSGYIERRKTKDDTLIYTSHVTRGHLRSLALIEDCPTLLQQKIEKERDIRVTVVDGQVYAVTLVAKEGGNQRLDIRRDEMEGVEHTLVEMPVRVRTRLLQLLRSYELRFAAVDFCVDHRGRWFFLEINPNGQWAWMDLNGVTKIAEGLAMALLHPPRK